MAKRDWRRAKHHEPEAGPDRSALPVDFLAAQRQQHAQRKPKPAFAGPRLPEKVAAVCDWLEDA